MYSNICLALVSIIDKHMSQKSKRIAKIKKTRLRLLRLLIEFESTQIKKNRPREWCFVKTSYFLEESLLLPDDLFSKKFRFSKKTFLSIVDNLTPYLLKKKLMREPISPMKRVAVGLYALKSGSDLSVIGDVFGISKSSVCRIIDKFLTVFIRVYNKKISFPISEEDQLETVQEFEKNWQFPGCIGALDGTHLPILPPSENSTDYYNYKNWHSVVMLAIVDSYGRFIWTYIGQPGKRSDGGSWESSNFQNKNLIRDPYHLVADAAFPISTKLLKPFPGDSISPIEKNFNYRLSRARMTIECAFGRLKGRFRVLLRRCDWNLVKMVKCIQVCTILHNIAEENKEIFQEKWLKKVEEFDKIYPQPVNNSFVDNFVRKQEAFEKRLNIMNSML